MYAMKQLAHRKVGFMTKKKSEGVKSTGFSLYPHIIAMLDAMRGRESRSSFIRQLIEQAWAEFSKKE
jgi:metal-responsive CopG/Arc/MetJ family transcriptional regulator